MGLRWPFKRREPVASGFERVEYDAQTGADAAEATLSDRSHIEDAAYQDALAKLTGSAEADQGPVVQQVVVAHETEQPGEEAAADLIATASKVVATTTDATPAAGEGEGEWVDNNDGYWYWRRADGTFDDAPHIRRSDGSMQPYAG